MLPKRKSEEDPMSSMERGSRAEGASQAAELALVPVGKKESKGRKERGESSDGGGKVVTQQGFLEIEDVPNRPEGPPETFGPKQLEPLFNEEQMRQAEELAAKAPMLQNQRRVSMASEWVGGSGVGEMSGSPQELEVMGVRASMGATPPGIMLPSMGLQPPSRMVSPNMGPPVLAQGYNPMQGWVEEQMRMQVQLQQEVMLLSQNMKSLQEENVRLKIQLVEERETKYSTPPDERMIEKSLKSTGKSGEKKRNQQERSKEDGSRDQQERSKEDGSRDQQGHLKEDGPRGHQDPSEEDGPRGRQEQHDEDGPRGRQEAQAEEDGSRDRQDQEDGENRSEALLETSSESDSGREGKRRRRDRVSKDAFDTMLTLMQGMQKMQQQMLQHRSRSGKEQGDGHEDEALRGGVDLHQLPEWSPDTAPVDLQDWLLLVDPQMCDISASSYEWWALTLETARKWYQHHQSLKPIEKLQHKVTLPVELQKANWKRLERRASNMLLRALPESQREDIIAGKDLSVLAILTKLMVNYQPGGGQEKAAVLSALELPAEASTIGDAIAGLRKWLRWKKRALDMGLVLPDPSVLLRGLDRLVGKVVSSYPTLQFRINLTRTTLMIDAVPTMTGIEQLAECIMAELDQVSYAKKKSAALQAPKVKRMEENGREGMGGRKNEEEKKDVPKCKFYLTEEGCRRGKGCRFSHDQKDEMKRCWSCGSTKHFSNKCPVKEGDKTPSPPKMARAERNKEDAKNGKGEDEEVQSNRAALGQGEDMKMLLEEASRMLKSMPGTAEGNSSSEDGEAKIRNLQRQLDELKGSSLRVLRLARVQPCDEELGLLDSGATHCLRPPLHREDVSKYAKVRINLAGGQCAELRMSPGRVVVGEEGVEPIVPLGHLVSKLGCSLQWTQDELVVVHPERGQIRTTLKEGCPMVTKKLAMKLIQELEEKIEGSIRVLNEEDEPIRKWLQRLVEEHPVFQDLPAELKAALVTKPQVHNICGNRRRRKLWRREGGVNLYMYSGEKAGYTYERAVKELGGDHRKVIQVDIKNGEKWDMVNGKVYSELLSMAIDGQIDTILTSPNCRTRSKLRHVKIPGMDLPGPARCWQGGEWGLPGGSETERKKCWDDDVMMFRSWMVFLVAQECRKAEGRKENVNFLLEHPSPPEDMPEVVSIWRTSSWKKMKDIYRLEECEVDQGDLGSGSTKPTTLGTNLKLEFPKIHGAVKKKRNVEGKTKEQVVQESKMLSRWTPVMTSGIAEAVLRKGGVEVKIRSWRTHVRQHHYPFRKDCQVCQEAAAKGRPHLRQKLPPKAAVLSLDLAGPMVVAEDVNRKKAKYVLVGAFTWPTGEDGEEIEEKVEEEVEAKEEEVALQLEDSKEEEEDILGGEVKAMEVEEEQEGENHELDEELRGPEDDHKSEEREEEEVMKDAQVKVHRMAIPLPSKNGDDLLRGVADLYLMLRSEGLYVRQIHSDLGREFKGHGLSKWCMERGVLQTFTSGADPQGNGRAERSVQAMKVEVRKMLRGAEVGAEFWPLAVRHLNEVWRRNRRGITEGVPPFMSKVIVKKRYWKAKDFDPKNEVVKYIAPSWLYHGHWIMRDDGTKALTRAVISRTQEPITDEVWIALEDAFTPMEARQRIRGKSVVKRLKVEENRPKEDERRREQVMHEEAARLVYDDVEVAPIVAEGIRMMQAQVEEPTEEILQTKIVSPAEVKQKIERWKKAIEAEIESLFQTKKALKLVEKEEMRKMMKEQGVVPLPSKVIFTLKPDGNNPQGKRKCRIVACGNYAAPEEEANYFAAGADAASLRLVLSLGARKRWGGYNMDVRTAFLNAPWKGEKRFEDSEEEDDQKPVIIKPPGILVTLGYFTADQGWEVHRALYGFRQSPKLWSDYRDQQLEGMRVGDFYLKQLESESCIWLLKKPEDEEIYGALVTYVDDLLLLGKEELIVPWVKEIQKKWEVSEPERVKEGSPTRFLGMELSRTVEGHWHAKQEAYTKDLLLRNLGQEQERWPRRKVPVAREEETETEDKEESERTPAQVKEAQRVVGELIWLVTRCRPDIMYATASMSTLTTRKPLKVMRMAHQVWCYLAGTMEEGLIFRGDGEDLMVYTDASFGEEDAHGCVIVKWGEDPLVWRSSKQNLLTTSTAEAELVEVMEGAVTTEALRVLVEEVMEQPVRCWQFTDSSSALTIIIGDTASWRTRHLRKRARFLRWKALRGDVLMRHQPGVEMVADMGTKPLSAVKLKEHKKRLGMIVQEMEVKSRPIRTQGDQGYAHQEKGRLRLALMMALIVRGKAQGREGKKEENWEFEVLMATYTMLVIAVTIAIQVLWRKIYSGWKPELELRSEEEPDRELVLKRPACLDAWSGLENHTEEDPVCELAPKSSKKEKKEEETQKKAQAESSRSYATSSSSTTPGPTLEALQRNKIPREDGTSSRSTSWLVAGNGKRYHRLRHCTGVKMSKQVQEVKLCRVCEEKLGGNIPENATLFATSIYDVMHTSQEHYKKCHPDQKPRTFEPCQVCKPSKRG